MKFFPTTFTSESMAEKRVRLGTPSTLSRRPRFHFRQQTGSIRKSRIVRSSPAYTCLSLRPPLFRFGPNRVQFDVGGHFHERVSALHEHAAKPSLPKRALPGGFFVTPAGGHFDQDVKMVAHHAKSHHGHGTKPLIFAQHLHKHFLLGIPKNESPVRSPV